MCFWFEHKHLCVEGILRKQIGYKAIMCICKCHLPQLFGLFLIHFSMLYSPIQ
jgi:hypothetical protein